MMQLWSRCVKNNGGNVYGSKPSFHNVAGREYSFSFVYTGLSVRKKYFSLKWRYGILKIAAAFYLLPVPVYKYLIIDVIYRFFRGRGWENNRRISGMIDMEYIIIIGRDFVEFSSGVSRMLLVVLLSGIISFAIIQRRMIRYWKWKRVRSVNSENLQTGNRNFLRK
ncbi:hypothetical protein C823_000377 [Eubacterium plexicaudatum ASF492]|nr:hypothetical protein C823_000377 [Eubacterium plexicaudatum ASF492]